MTEPKSHWIVRLLEDEKGVPDEMRVGFLITVIGYNLAYFVAVFLGHPWPPLEYAGGIALIMPAFGAGLNVRKDN